MKTCTKPFEITTWGRWKVLWVRSDCIGDCLACYNAGGADGLGVSPQSGFVGHDLDFLEQVKRLQGFVLPFAAGFDLGLLHKHTGLRFLTVGESTQQLDCNAFPELEDLRVEWKTTVLPADGFSQLTTLYIEAYRPDTGDLTALPKYPRLRSLELNQGTLVSLEGIERFVSLRDAQFYYLKQLERVSPLRATPVEFLHFQVCKKIRDLPSLSACKSLRVLRFNDCGELASLAFLNEFRLLEEFRFAKTNVLDGNLTPLLRLKEVGFLPKRHFSHTQEQIMSEIARRKQGVAGRE